MRGHRAFYSYKQSWLSLWSLHNQTVNVWTHIIGLFVCIQLIFTTWYTEIHPLLQSEDRILVTIYLLLACYTMWASVMFHLHQCVSEKAESFFGCLDYSGISASIAGGSISLVYLILHW